MKYAYQGGIKAVNGFYNNFNVTQIQTVAITSGVKRDRKKETEQYQNINQNSEFAKTLKNAIEEYETSEYFYSTYNSKSQLQPLYYIKPREYSN